jgi:hypothetical protein
MLTSNIVKNRMYQATLRCYAVIKYADIKYTVSSVSMFYTILRNATKKSRVTIIHSKTRHVVIFSEG